MNTRRTLALSLGTALLASPQLMPLPTAQAQDTKAPTKEALPTPSQVLDAFIEASGGREAGKSINSMTIKGKMSIPAAGLTGTALIYKARPDKTVLIIDLPNMGTTKQGYNGKVGWTMDLARGPSLMTGDMLQQTKREADFDANLNAMEYYDEIKVVGFAEFDGQKCAELTFKKGDLTETRFYNTKTHLLAGTKGIYPTEMGKIPVVTHISDYKKFKDPVTNSQLLIPTKTSMQMMGMEQQLIFDSIGFNDVDPTVFDLPPAIKALAERKAATDSDSSSSSSSSKDSDSSSSSSSSKDSDSSSSSSSSKDSDSSSSSSSSKDSDSSKSSKKKSSSSSSSSSSSNSSSSGTRRGG